MVVVNKNYKTAEHHILVPLRHNWFLLQLALISNSFPIQMASLKTFLLKSPEIQEGN